MEENNKNVELEKEGGKQNNEKNTRVYNTCC